MDFLNPTLQFKGNIRKTLNNVLQNMDIECGTSNVIYLEVKKATNNRRRVQTLSITSIDILHQC